MVFNAVFNSISVISLRPMYLSMHSWTSLHQNSAQYSFKVTTCFPYVTFVKTLGNSDRGVIPLAILGKSSSLAGDRTCLFLILYFTNLAIRARQVRQNLWLTLYAIATHFNASRANSF